MSFFKLQNLWQDPDDETVNFNIALSDGLLVFEQDFYDYADGNILEFAQKLQNFPKYQKECIQFEYGQSNSDSYSHIVLRVYSNGIMFKSSNNKNGMEEKSAKFFLSCEPAAMNRIGHNIERWLKGGMQENFEENWS